MKKVKYISNRRGQGTIIVATIVIHLVLMALVYFFLFDTNIVRFDEIAVFLCSGNMIRKSIWKLLWRGFLIFMGIGAVGVIVDGPAPGTPKYSHDNGPVFVYTLNSPGSHGYWW